jgi:arylsulfatase A-like enzyme
MSTSRPNIVLIMTDQQRFDTIAAWGNEHMITPNMDRLAAESVSFRQAYCPGATCIASRAAIFTGMYPHNTGVYTFQHWAAHRVWVQDLNDAGYHCVNMGKMHYSPRDVPGGFHERVIVENPTNTTAAMGGADDDWGRFLRLNGQERPNFRNKTDPTWMQKYQGVPWHLEERFHSDVFIGDSASAWVHAYQGKQPFFLQVGLTGPHEPWDPLPRHLDLYAGRELPKAVLREGELAEKPPQHAAHQRMHAETSHESCIDLRGAGDAEIDHMRRHYYAKITTVDEQVGKLLAALEARGFLDNSLVIFCSDHGELLGDHNLAYKWLVYDPIVHIPLMIKLPAGAPAPATARVDDLVSLIDLGPTILEAAGIDVPDYLEGRSLLPYLEGERTEPRHAVYCEDNYQIMLRTETHKLVYYIGQEMGDLYDLAQDPHELWNRWDDPDYGAVKTQLLHDLMAWFTTSVYYNAGYTRERIRHDKLRWPDADDAKLHGGNMRPKQVSWL